MFIKIRGRNRVLPKKLGFSGEPNPTDGVVEGLRSAECIAFATRRITIATTQ